ncbi:MAG: hypothetical protein H6745_27960 [Deltaproteobacteria bacterium]|nr:hypothetical protein [Deltaproteobacteria bacterium]
MNAVHSTAATLALAPAVAGCADDAGDPGTAPTVAGLTVTPDHLTAGQVVTLSGSLTFDDPDGDVALLASELVTADGATADGPEAEVAGAAGLRSGTVPFAFALASGAAGTLTLRVWLVDAAGNASNALETTLTVE